MEPRRLIKVSDGEHADHLGVALGPGQAAESQVLATAPPQSRSFRAVNRGRASFLSSAEVYRLGAPASMQAPIVQGNCSWPTSRYGGLARERAIFPSLAG